MEHVYLQDPTFNDLDTEFLGELGYTILKTPDALNKMTSTTFLFAPHLETVVVAEALECASPSVYIGNILEDWIIECVLCLIRLVRTLSKGLTNVLEATARSPWLRRRLFSSF